MHIETLENRVHLSAVAKPLPSIDVAVESSTSSFSDPVKPKAKGTETVVLQNLGDVTARGRIVLEAWIDGADGTSYTFKVPQALRGISLRAGATKTYLLHLALPASMSAGTDYTLQGDFYVLSGFADPAGAGTDFSDTPISIASDSSGNVGYFTFSPFSATQLSGSARAHIFSESGTVTAYPGESEAYTYIDEFGVGQLQIMTQTSDNEFTYLSLEILHHAPTRLNAKTITIVASSKGASGSGSLIEEGFAIPGITYNQQVAYCKLS